MRNDLLEAQACVDWAVSHFPSLENRFGEWLGRYVRVIIKDPDPKVPNNIVVITEEEPLPLALSVEVGAYINVLRTSLDILATSLAYRYGVPHPDKTYFPVANSREDFLRGNYKRKEFVEGLPDLPRTLLENLFPYKGGNDLLWALHQLDITRKHRNLLFVELHPATLTIIGLDAVDVFTPIGGSGFVSANQETIVGLISKGAAEPKIHVSAHVAFNQPEIAPVQSEVIPALRNFAGMADAIIKTFDFV
jgi:hypothetical protein